MIKNFNAIERYPHRNPLDIVDNITKYIENKVVCDIGCGAGDVLEYMKIRKLCKAVKGVENNPKRYVKERQYIQFGNVLELGIPNADVYLLWLSDGFPYENIFKQIKEEKIIIYMDGYELYQKNFQRRIKGLSLIESINYNYNEEKFVPKNELESWKKYLFEKKKWREINYPTHPDNWNPIGKRLCKIYKYTP